MNDPLVLVLFVTPENRHRAMANLSLALQPLPKNEYYVLECNVREVPEIVEAVRILATPTLIRYWPVPRVEIIGDLSEVEKVRGLLISHNRQDPQLIHKLYAKQDLRHEELADRLREAEIEKWTQLFEHGADRSGTFPFDTMEQLSDWARALGERESQLRHREKFISKRESNFSDGDGDKGRRAKA
jgi:circadian clock protein KaiB